MSEYSDIMIGEGESDIIKKITDEIHNTYPKSKGWIPVDCYDMVQCGYPLSDHGEMFHRPDGVTNETGELLPSTGKWCKVEDVMKLLKKYEEEKVTTQS